MQVLDVLIIGSGFGGQCSAIRLKKAGIENFHILERRSFPGGTWCQNTYPGAAVDVQSPLYSFSFEPYPWSQMFAEQNELEQYTKDILSKYDLNSKTTLNANVNAVHWDETEKHWVIQTDDGSTYRAKFVINCSGPLSMPSIPDFKGRDTFAGTSFHTNDWQHDYDFKGKRVAIIGSGASAAQIIPAIVSDVAQLHVFQRTPHWVMPRHDRVFTPSQRKWLSKHWAYKALRASIYWGLETRVVGFKYSQRLLKLFAQDKAMRHLKKQINDPELRQKLTPDYTIGCKRIILSSTLYPALSQAHTTLHDKNQGIAQITPTGITTMDGREVALDLIIYSTGYDATDGAVPYPIVGRDNASVQQFWSEFPRAYLGTTMPKLPNFFLMIGPNTGIGHTSAIFIMEAQSNYITECIAHILKNKLSTVEVKPEAEDKYTTMIHSEMKKTVWAKGGCHSWYQSKSGHVIAMFPGFSFSYRNLTRHVKWDDHIVS